MADDPLFDIASRVSDAAEPDWEGAERAATDPRGRRVLDSLREIERIAREHRRWGLIDAASVVTEADARQRGPLSGRTLGGYLVLDLLGRGGMGEVYRGWDGDLHREVAIKVLSSRMTADDVARRRFDREPRLACKVAHPYVATVYDVVVHQDQLVLVMELLRGRRLDQVLLEDRPSAERVLAWAGEIAEALQAIHDAGVVHRDLKPGNVMIAATDHVKVMDFGVARPALDDAGDSTAEAITEEGRSVGTIVYMSPEQIRGAQVDARSDLFSFGIVLWEALTGQHPFRRRTAVETATAILNDPPGTGGVVPPEVGELSAWPLVQRLLEKDPAHRPADARTVVDGLRALRAVSSSRGSSSAPVGRPVPRRRVVIAGVAAMVLAIAAYVAMKTAHPRHPTARTLPLVAVLPFEDHTGGGNSVMGAMTAAWLTAGIAESGRAHAADPERVDEVLASLGNPPTRQAGIGLISKNLLPDWLATGEIWAEEGDLLATLRLRGPGRRENVFRVRAGSAGALAELLLGRLLGEVAPEAADSASDFIRTGSRSDEARDLEFRARRARKEMRLADARILLERSVALDPGFLLAEAMLVDVLRASGHVTRARQVAGRFHRVLKTRTDLPASLRLEIEIALARAEDDRLRLEASLRERSARRPDDPGAYLALATFLRGRSAEESLGLVGRAIALDPQDPRAHREKAKSLARLGRWDESESSLARAEHILRGLDSVAGLAAVEKDRGDLDMLRGRFAPARDHFGTAAGLYERGGLPARSAAARADALACSLMSGETSGLEADLRRILTISRAEGDHLVSLSVLEKMAGHKFTVGLRSEAEGLYRQAVIEAREIGHEEMRASLQLNLASLLGYSGRYGEARALAEDAAEVGSRLRNPIFHVMGRLLRANSDRQLGRLADSEAEFRALESECAPGAPGSERRPAVLASFALVLTTLGRLEEAAAVQTGAIELFEAQSRQDRAAYCRVSRGLVFADLAERDRAEADFARAARVVSEGAAEHADLSARVAIGRARAAWLRGDPRGARRWVSTARAVDGERLGGGAREQLDLMDAAVMLDEQRWAGASRLAREVSQRAGAEFEHRIAATVLEARAHMAQDASEAESLARRALDEAEDAGYVFVAADAAALLMRLDSKLPDAAQIARRGRVAAEKYLQGVGRQREEVKTRTDVKKWGVLKND